MSAYLHVLGGRPARELSSPAHRPSKEVSWAIVVVSCRWLKFEIRIVVARSEEMLVIVEARAS